jgi:ABC-type transporter Mla subunit MlaD
MTSPLAALRRRLDVVPAQHKTRPVLLGAVVITFVVLALYSAAARNIPLINGKPGDELRIEFAAANQVSNRTVVRVGGIDVGRVDKVEPGSDPYRTSVAIVRITDDDIDVKRDATAKIRWRTLFGGLMYIDLEPGSDGAPSLGDAPIPAGNTSTQVELDQFLQPYDGNTDEAQRAVLKGLSATFADPRGIGRSIDALSPNLRNIERGLAPLRGQRRDDLRRLVVATSRTVAGLDDPDGLRALTSGANRTLAVTAARRAELGRLLELSPPSLASTFTTMRRLRTTLGHLDPLAARLRPGVRALEPAARATTPALAQTEALLAEARPLLKDAKPTFASLAGAGRAGVPLMNELDPTLRRLDGELIPYLHERDPETRLRNLEAIGPFWASLAMAASEYDAEGHRIRFTVPPGVNSLIGVPPSP